MKIYISKTVQMTDTMGEYLPVSETSFNYEGTVGLCKGDPVAQQAEQQQMSFDQTLQNTFQQQYATQKSQLDYLNSKMQPLINNPTGLSDAELAAARTSATDQDSAAYQNAQQALNAKMASSGDTTLPSGVGSQLDAALMNSEAAQKSGDQNQITMQNAQLKQQNYWNAVNALNGVAAQEAPVNYANASTSGSGAVSSLSQANTAAAGPTIGSILGGVVSGVAGAAGQAGGFGKLFGCWIAAAIWGSLDPRTLKVREYIHFSKFTKTWYGSIISKLYMKHGIWVSQQPVLISILKPAFNMALNAAGV